jgi:hypothetical protein
MNLPAFHACGRNQHRQIGLAAGAGKSAADVANFAVRILNAHNQHMLGQPTFALPELARNAQGQAFLGEKGVSSVTRSNGPNGIVLGVMANEASLDIEVGLGMKAAGEVIGVAQMFEGHLAHARHHTHVEHDVYAVGHLNTDFAERRTGGTHEKRDDVQGAPLHGAGKNL